jgi:putative PIN family toxin of toxin-antitoxin system
LRIVLDTNVLVSGLLRATSPPGDIVRWVALGEVELCFDSRILSEYRGVLLRPKFGFSAGRMHDLVDHIRSRGHSVTAPPLSLKLPGLDDLPFFEVAAASQAPYLVTGNVRHFPFDERFATRIVSPRRFVEELRQSK